MTGRRQSSALGELSARWSSRASARRRNCSLSCCASRGSRQLSSIPPRSRRGSNRREEQPKPMEEPRSTRYSWGGDEYLFVELAEEMSMGAYFRSMAIVTTLRERRPDGVIDICPANASYQVRYDPDRLQPQTLKRLLQEIDGEVGDARDFKLETRIVEIPVLYGEPRTHQTLMRVRHWHQPPDPRGACVVSASAPKPPPPPKSNPPPVSTTSTARSHSAPPTRARRGSRQ